MLTKPDCGWADITIGAFCDRCSYVQNVPSELLDALIERLGKSKPTVVEIDAEGYNYAIVFGMSSVYVIHDVCEETEAGVMSDGDESTLMQLDVPVRSLASELIADIRRDIDVWGEWCLPSSEKDREDYKATLLVKCNQLEASMDSTA